MIGRTLYEAISLKTQKTQAIASLATYLGKEISSEGVLDLKEIKLVKSNKGDAFYTVSAKGCSCPSAAYRPGQACKHQRKLFPQAQAKRQAKKLSVPPEEGYTKHYSVGFKPVMPMEA